jgi:8-oxo-dGTP pyrophosphatase MutT (NUDIX family)
MCNHAWRWKNMGAQKTQYAALPVALEGGEPRVMLITTRGTGRWIIPKGHPERKLKPHELAAKEAYEEAGVIGRVHSEAIGSYRVGKPKDEPGEAVTVEVFLLEVDSQLDDWPEKGQRETRWFSLAQAAMKVTDGGLVEILLGLAAPPPDQAVA